jgi:3-dehydroquinate synthase
VVRVGRGALRLLPADLTRRLAVRDVVVVSDATVARLHGGAVVRALAAAGFRTRLLTFPAGERSKTRSVKARLEDRLVSLGIGRDAAIVALGGGVTSDLAGFLAATWHRGVPVAQAPTTLLAMVDAAIGGKTGVDLPAGKNLVGAFHQPVGVWADPSVLETLPRTELASGFAEVVKIAAVTDRALFAWLESNAAALRARSPRVLERAIAASMAAKARVVSRDERESGRRAILNFGHTVAHAIEAASGYRIRHGAAVALGLAVESRLAVAATGLPPGAAARIARLLEALDASLAWPRSLDPERVVAATRRDKKNRLGRVRYALPVGLGRMPVGSAVTVAVPEKDLRRAIRAHRGSSRIDFEVPAL